MLLRMPALPTRCSKNSAMSAASPIYVQQQADYPNFISMSTAQVGYTVSDVANSMWVWGSFQVTPMFYLEPKSGVEYYLIMQTPQYDIQSRQDLQNIPLTAANQRQPGSPMSRAR